MLQPIIQRSYLTEVNMVTVSANQRYNFQFTPQLADRSAVIYAMQCFTAADLVVSPNGKAVVSSTGAGNIVITLVEGDDEVIYSMPYLDYRPASNGGLIRTFKPRNINVSKSYITLYGVTNLNANESVMVNFIYSIGEVKS